MAGDVHYCNNCRRNIAAANYVIHAAHCERKIQLCELCNEPVPRTEMTKHVEEYHSLDSCELCGDEMERWQMTDHKDSCCKRHVSCKFCGLESPFDVAEEHEIVCGTRTEKCPTCKTFVKLMDQDAHKTLCQREKRNAVLSVCEHCCGEMPSYLLHTHIPYCASRIENCSTCLQPVPLKDKYTHQCKDQYNTGYNTTQDLLFIPCEYCGTEIPSDRFVDHGLICGLQLKNCPKCKDPVMLKDRDAHTCQSPVKTTGQCSFCHACVPWVDLREHEAGCRLCYQSSEDEKEEKPKFAAIPTYKKRDSSPIYRKRDASPTYRKRDTSPIYRKRDTSPIYRKSDSSPTYKKRDSSPTYKKRDSSPTYRKRDTSPTSYMKRESSYSHAESRSQKEKQEAPTILKMKQCQYCKERFPDLIVEEHSKDCNHRSYDCYHCGKSVLMKDKSKHEKRDCKGMKGSRTDNFADNEKYQAFSTTGYTKEYEKRLKLCPYCDKTFPEIMFSDHQEGCDERPYTCNLCLKAMPWKNRFSHESNECTYLNRVDKLFSGKENYSASGATGYTKEYEKRLQLCPYCNKKFPEIMFTDHRDNCEERPYQCGLCLKMMPWKYKINHESKECLYMDRFKKALTTSEGTKSKDVPVYKKSFEKDYLEKNFQACPYCKNRIPDAKIAAHVQSCSEGKKPCRFCGEEIRVDEEMPHLKNCIARVEDNSGFQTSGGKRGKKKNKKGKQSEPEPQKGWLSRATNFLSGKSSTPTKGFVQETYFSADVVHLPCEFCDELFPEYLIIEHQSGCRPDLVCLPNAADANKSADHPRASPNEDRYQFKPRDQPKASPDGDMYRYTPRDNPKASPDEDGYRYTPRDHPNASPTEDSYQYRYGDPRNTGALPKRNRFHRDDADTKPGEYLSRNSPPSEGLDFYNYRSGVPDNRTEPDVVNQSKTAFKSRDKTPVNKTANESLDKKLHGTNSETQLFNFSSSSSNNNSSSYLSKSPPSMFSRRDDSYSPTRQRYSEAQKTELKAVGAERAERKGIHRITQDTLIGEGESGTAEEYGTNYQIPRHSRNSDNMHDIKKDQYSSKFICSERGLNIPFADETSVMVHSEQLNSTTEARLARMLNVPELNDLTEDDAKNDETFGSDFDPRQPLPLSNDEGNLSDSMEQFYDAEDDLRTSDRETVKCLRNGGYDQNINSYVKMLTKDEDEMIASNENRRSSSSASEKVVNCGDCGNRICYCGIANRSSNMGNNNFLETEGEGQQHNSHSAVDSRRLTAYSNANRGTNLNAEERNALNVKNQQTCAEVKKRSSKFNDWRSSKGYNSDSE